jgi:hypothetical protein
MSSPLPRGDYYAFVGRAGRRPCCQVIAWPLRATLPDVPIPLLPEDPEVPLNVQATLQSAYDASLYDLRLPYDQPLVPPLAEVDQARVCERLERHPQSRR